MIFKNLFLMKLSKPKKEFRCQPPIYGSIAQFMLKVQAHPELLPNFTDDDDDGKDEYVPFDKCDAIDYMATHQSNQFRKNVKKQRESRSAKAEPELPSPGEPGSN